MTPEQATKILPVIKAFSEGKMIQANYSITEPIWMDISSPSFSPSIDWRIKPEKKKYRVALWTWSNGLSIRAITSERCSIDERSYQFIRWLTEELEYECE